MGELFSGFFNRTVLVAFGLGLVFSLILGPIIIPMLHKLKFGQNIRKDGPQSHMKKAGTPTIGGLIFLISITLFQSSFVPNVLCLHLNAALHIRKRYGKYQR